MVTKKPIIVSDFSDLLKFTLNWDRYLSRGIMVAVFRDDRSLVIPLLSWYSITIKMRSLGLNIVFGTWMDKNILSDK